MCRSFSLLFCAFLWLPGVAIVQAKSLPANQSSEQLSNAAENTHRTQDLLDELRGKPPADIVKSADKAFTDKEYPTAIRTYHALNSLYPFSEYAEWAWIQTIQAYYHNAEMDKVIRAVDQFIRWYLASEHLETAYYRRAMAYFDRRDKFLSMVNDLFRSKKIDFSQRANRKELTEAAHQFSAFLRRFPTGVYRKEIQQKLDEVHRILVNKEYRIAYDYFRSHAYVAAYNRIVELLQSYPQARDMLGKKEAAILDKVYQASRKKLGLGS